MNRIELIIVALAVVLLLGTSEGYPIQGSNGVVSSVIFDGFKNPIEDSPGNSTLSLDLGITRGVNVSLALMDDQDQVYYPDVNLSSPLQPGRLLIVFVIPTNSSPVAMNITPDVGDPFLMMWEDPAKYTNGVANFRFHGLSQWQIASIGQILTIDISLSNNGTSGDIIMGPENFTIVDQWGWRYIADQDFDPVTLNPKTKIRRDITFSSLSPRSRPVLVQYDYSTDHSITIRLDCSLDCLGSDETTEAAPEQTSTGSETSTASQQSSPTTTASVSGGQQNTTEVQAVSSAPRAAPLAEETTQDKVTAQKQTLAQVNQMLHGN